VAHSTYVEQERALQHVRHHKDMNQREIRVGSRRLGDRQLPISLGKVIDRYRGLVPFQVLRERERACGEDIEIA